MSAIIFQHLNLGSAQVFRLRQLPWCSSQVLCSFSQPNFLRKLSVISSTYSSQSIFGMLPSLPFHFCFHKAKSKQSRICSCFNVVIVVNPSLLLETFSYFAVWNIVCPSFSSYHSFWFSSFRLLLDPSCGVLLLVLFSLLACWKRSVSGNLFPPTDSLGDPSSPLGIYVIHLSTSTFPPNFRLDYPTAVQT